MYPKPYVLLTPYTNKLHTATVTAELSQSRVSQTVQRVGMSNHVPSHSRFPFPFPISSDPGPVTIAVRPLLLFLTALALPSSPYQYSFPFEFGCISHSSLQPAADSILALLFLHLNLKGGSLATCSPSSSLFLSEPVPTPSPSPNHARASIPAGSS